MILSQFINLSTISSLVDWDEVDFKVTRVRFGGFPIGIGELPSREGTTPVR